MVDPSTLLPFERTVIVEFANVMRDIDTAALLARPTTPVSKSKKRKLWKNVSDHIEPLMADSYRALNLLVWSDNQELRDLAEKSLKNETSAIRDLRRLANRIKQDETPATGRKEWTSSQPQDTLNQ